MSERNPTPKPEPEPRDEKLRDLQRLVREVSKPRRNNVLVLSLLTEFAANYYDTRLLSPQETADALNLANDENRGLMELLARYAEALAKSDTTSSEASVEAIGFLLLRHQERLDNRVSEAASALYAAQKKQSAEMVEAARQFQQEHEQ